jgi:hypothetical protein
MSERPIVGIGASYAIKQSRDQADRSLEMLAIMQLESFAGS